MPSSHASSDTKNCIRRSLSALGRARTWTTIRLSYQHVSSIGADDNGLGAQEPCEGFTSCLSLQAIGLGHTVGP